MVKFDIVVNLNPQRVAKRLVDNDKVAQELSTRAFKLMDKYVPFDTGTLAHTVEITPGRIHYKSDYAKYCYYGSHMNFSKEHNKLATAYWDKAMMRVYGKQLARQIEDYIRRGQK